MVAPTLVDSNVILDIVTEDPVWQDWSADALARCADRGRLVINLLIYAEVSIGFERIEDLEDALPGDYFTREPLPWQAAFLAGKAFHSYRKRQGVKRHPLPDFYIGAHAALYAYTLLTRDPRHYRTYFPRLRLISP